MYATSSLFAAEVEPSAITAVLDIAINMRVSCDYMHKPTENILIANMTIQAEI